MEECIICFHETDEFAYFPCTHKICETCFPKMPTQLCPICETSWYEAKITERIEPEPVESIRIERIDSYEYTSFLVLVQSSCCVLFITIAMYSLLSFAV